MAERVLDLAIAPRCAACDAALPRLVNVPDDDSRHTVELRCPVCLFSVAFVGPGLILDRRRPREDQ
jgi:hypothetical protein